MLTKHQKEKLKECKKILKKSKRLLIKGSAGVGKTFLVNYLLETLPNKDNKYIYCTAPTNKALSVLQEKITPQNGTIFQTTHKALQVKRQICEKTGIVSFKSSLDKDNNPFKTISYFIVDEASMLPKELLDVLNDVCIDTTLILLGDGKQLPPVNEDDSPAFISNFPEVELTEIVRQGNGNPIIELSYNLQGVYEYKNNFLESKEGYFFSNNTEKMYQSIIESDGKNKFLAYTNFNVNIHNKKIRQMKYGNDPEKIELGDVLILGAPYEKFTTNEQVVVETLHKGIKTTIIHPNGKDRVDVSYYLVNPKVFTNEISVGGLKILDRDSEEDFKKFMSKLKKDAVAGKVKWKTYYDIAEKFASTKYNYAATVHTSQGSTYKKVFIDLRDLHKNKNKKELQKLLYTAITRASKTVIFYV